MMSSSRLQATRGFNLVEAAIVLGVVGLVIGGIWVAAVSVQQNMKLNQAVTGTLTVVQNARRIFPPELAPGNHTLTGDLTTMLLSGVDGFKVTGVVAMHPIGTAQDGWNPLIIEIQPSFVGLTFYSLNKSMCINLISRVTSRFRDQTNLINASADGTLYTTLPVSPDTTALCASPADPTDSNSHYVTFAFVR